MSSTSSQACLVLRRTTASVSPSRGARVVASRPSQLGRVPRRSFFKSSAVGVDAHVHAFGRLIKAAVVDKDGKKTSGTKEHFKSSKAQLESQEVSSTIDQKKSDAARSIDSDREQVRSSLGSKQEGLFDMNIARQKAIVDAAAAPAIEPMFSLRAQAKAYELHKINSRTSEPAISPTFFYPIPTRSALALPLFFEITRSHIHCPPCAPLLSYPALFM